MTRTEISKIAEADAHAYEVFSRKIEECMAAANSLGIETNIMLGVFLNRIFTEFNALNFSKDETINFLLKAYDVYYRVERS